LGENFNLLSLRFQMILQVRELPPVKKIIFFITQIC